MNRSASTRTATAGNMVRTLAVSMLGLLPVAVVSTMMLMQILGIWTY